MIRSNLRAVTVLIGLALVTACNATPTPTPEPTMTSTSTEVSLVVRTLPPSWTPGAAATSTPRGQDTTATPLAQNTLLARNTLPPTWTPGVAPTVTPQPRAAFATFTPIPPSPTPAVSPTRSLLDGPPPISTDQVYDTANCPSFNAFTDPDQYKHPGTSVQIGWYVITNADSYEVWLRNPDGRFIYHDNVAIATGEIVGYHQFEGSFFVGPGAYAWEVYPLKAKGRLCPSITGTIYINNRY